MKIGSCQYGNKRAHKLGRTHIFNTGQCARLWVPIKAQMNYSVNCEVPLTKIIKKQQKVLIEFN